MVGALDAYQAALAACPDDPDLLAALAELAARIELHEVAAKLWRQVSALQPERLEAADGQARALRELGRFDEAVALLRETLMAHPEEPRLWNTLGVTLAQQGDSELALTFLDEAVRLDPGFAVALHNRGGARFDLGQLEAAAADFQAAGKLARKPADRAMIEFAAATLKLAQGKLAEGWDAYEARFSPDLSFSVVFDAPGRPWTPKTPLAGRRLLVLAEQGLGDEIMFANMLPDVLHDLGADGRLALAVEPRLVELFARSFPAAEVSAHATERTGPHPRRHAPGVSDPSSVELWAPMGSLARKHRRDLTAFPTASGYLTPDPVRVAHWRAWLGEGPPAIGLTWRSGKLLGDRRRQYPALEDWAVVMRSPGVRFVNVQYGDCGEELKALSEMAGREVLQPPGLDIRNQIDDLAALLAALDFVISVPNATGALAGAVGAPLAIIGGPAAWSRLGTSGHPWYPRARALVPARFGDWRPMLEQAAELARHRGRTEPTR